MIICIFTGFLTPLGTTPYTYLVKTMQGNTTKNISEHLPLTLINNKQMLIVFAVFILILIFTDTKASLRDFFMLGGLTLLTFISRRQASIFVIICSFIFAKLVASFLEKYDKKGTEVVMKFMTTILGKILTILIVVLLSFIMYKGKIDDEFVNKSSYPVEAANYILDNLNINEMRLFNEYNYGSYLIYEGIPVMIDSRCDLYTPQYNTETGRAKDGKDIFMDVQNIATGVDNYKNTFEKYGITHVITYSDSNLSKKIKLDKKYKKLYPLTDEEKEDDRFVIYERVDDEE